MVKAYKEATSSTSTLSYGSAGKRTLVWNRLISSLKFIMNAGEQVTSETNDEFLKVLGGLDSRVLQPAFGMAETCTCMTYNCRRV